MKKYILSIMLVVLTSLLLYGAGCSETNTQTSQSTGIVKEVVETPKTIQPEPQPETPTKTTEEPQTEPTMPKTETTTGKTYKVDISNFAFSPIELRIKKGDTVVWTNMDSVKHTVTSDSGAELDSSLLGQGVSYSHTFNKAGTYDYHCRPHPGMKAKIIVE